MADYNDLAQIDKLHAEQTQLSQALAILEEDGTVSSYVVAPVVLPDGPPPTMMSVNIMTVDPKQNLMAAVHANLTQRYNDINKELRDLGVTNTPPDQAGGHVAQRPA
jgi:hypothetical protein